MTGLYCFARAPADEFGPIAAMMFHRSDRALDDSFVLDGLAVWARKEGQIGLAEALADRAEQQRDIAARFRELAP